MLELTHVGLTLSGCEILTDVSLSVPRGSITVLVGKNGSGKSSLFRAVNREVPYTGSILLDGSDIAALSPRERARRLAVLPQLLPAVSLTVRELVALGRTPYLGLLSRPSREDTEAVSAALDAVGLTAFTEARVATLSGGERRRAFLGMTVAQGAELLLLDEPTTYLDTDARRGILSLVSRLVREEGKTALLVLHDPNDAIRIADRLILLDGGRVLFAGTPSDFIAEGLPERQFGLTRHTVVGEELPFYY